MRNMEAIIRCGNCGANNRIGPAKSGKEAICGRCKMPLSVPASPIIITDANFANEVGRSKLPFLLDFWAAWCGPCRMIAPIIDGLAKELAGKAAVGKIDVDANQQTAAKFGVRSIPTLIIFKDGREAERISGAASKEEILRRLNKFTAK